MLRLSPLQIARLALICSAVITVVVLPVSVYQQRLVAQTFTEAQQAKITEAVYLNQQGYESFSRGRAQEALETYQKALAIFREVGAKAGEAQTLNNLGNVHHYSLGEYDTALKFYQQALPLRRAMGDRAGEWATLDDLGTLYLDLRRNQSALDAYQEALAIIRQLRSQPENKTNEDLLVSERSVLHRLGGVYFRLGQYPQAQETYQKALALHQATRDLIGEAQTLNNLGVTAANTGEYARALELYQDALKLVRDLGDCYRQERGPKLCFYGDEAAILNNLGGLYFILGQYPKSLEMAQKAADLYNRFRDRAPDTPTSQEIALLYNRLGQVDQAIEVRQASLAGVQAVTDPSGAASLVRLGEGVNLNNLGRIYVSLGKLEPALKLHQQALKLYQTLKHKPGEAASLNNIGRVYDLMHRTESALKFHQQALAIYQQLGDKSGEGTVLSHIGQIYHRQQEYDAALKVYQQALALHKETGDRAAEGITLHAFGQALLQKQEPAAAAQTLFSSVKVLESLRPGLTDTDKVAIFETQARTYQTLQRALVQQKQTNTALEIAERGRARAFVELLSQRLSSQPTTPTALSAGQIQQVAKKHNATLVEYSLIEEENTPPQLFIWVVQPNGKITLRQVDLTGKEICPEKSTCSPLLLPELVSRSRQSLGVGGRGLSFNEDAEIRSQAIARVQSTQTQNPDLQKLYQILIAPIADLLPSDPTDRIVFIPQKTLFLVPFPALQDPEGKFLIQNHTILTAPAIQVLDLTWQQRQKLRQTAPQNVVILGNPTMPKVGEPPQPLSSLPGAEQEANAIALLFNTQPLIGSAANKSALLSQVSSARIIHLATHGLLDDFKRVGIPGAIALAPTPEDDGLLSASEILDLKLNAELVVLSACDTGRGKITGDGVIGLSRSLMAAGVPSVVVSLWQVPDAPTATLMTAFYQNLQTNPDKAQSLRQAMLTVMQQHPDPRDWAAFTLMGEAE